MSNDTSHRKDELSQKVATEEIDIQGTVINDGSVVDLAEEGKLAVSQSVQRVQLPQIKSLNPLTIPGAFSSSNLKKSKWTKDANL